MSETEHSEQEPSPDDEPEHHGIIDGIKERLHEGREERREKAVARHEEAGSAADEEAAVQSEGRDLLEDGPPPYLL